MRRYSRCFFERLEDRTMMAADLAWSVDTPYEKGNGLVSDGENTYISTANTGSVIKYDGDGNQVWSWDIGGPGTVSRMYVEGDSLYVRYSPASNTGWTAKLTLDGDVVWNEAILVGQVSNGYATVSNGTTQGVVSTDDFHTRLFTVDKAGTMVATDDGIFIGGRCDLGGFVTKYDFTGHEQWTHNFMGDPNADWGTAITVTELVAAPNGVYFSLFAQGPLTIGGDFFPDQYNQEYYAWGLLVQDDVVWSNVHGAYPGQLQSIDDILFVGANGYDQHGGHLYAIDAPGTAEIIRADPYSFSAVFYHWDEKLTRYDYTPDNPGQIEISTMGFVDPPPVFSPPVFSQPTPHTEPTQSINRFDPAFLATVAQYWAETSEVEGFTKKRRAA